MARATGDSARHNGFRNAAATTRSADEASTNAHTCARESSPFGSSRPAVRGAFAAAPLALGGAVLCWVAGFDVIYACQDVDFDRAQGLHSLPARLGVGRALLLARLLHVATVLLLLALYRLVPLHPVYLAGIAGVALLLAYEHSLVKKDDLSRVNAAFFTVNGWVGMGYLAATAAAVFLR